MIPNSERTDRLGKDGKSFPREKAFTCEASRRGLNEQKWMAICNITPDSFSDGGQCVDEDALAKHIQEAIAWGVSYIDIGAESTRPNADVVDVEDELDRLIPIFPLLKDLIKDTPQIQVSLDTRKAMVAQVGLASGVVDIINDVSGGLYDDAMFDLIADAGCPYILMHSRGTPKTMDTLTEYTHVVQEVGDELQRQIDHAMEKGVEHEQLILDPGIGFAKTQAQSLDLLKSLPKLKERLGDIPLLVGVSRKRVTMAGAIDGRSLPTNRREAQTGVLHQFMIEQGAVDILRVHDVPQHVAAMQLMTRLQ